MNEPLTMTQMIERVRRNIQRLNVMDEKLTVSKADGTDVQLGLESLLTLTGLSHELFSFGCYIQMQFLGTGPPEDVRDRIEKAWLKYNIQIQNTMMFLGPLMAPILKKHAPKIVKPGDPGYMPPPNGRMPPG